MFWCCDQEQIQDFPDGCQPQKGRQPQEGRQIIISWRMH